MCRVISRPPPPRGASSCPSWPARPEPHANSSPTCRDDVSHKGRVSEPLQRNRHTAQTARRPVATTVYHIRIGPLINHADVTVTLCAVSSRTVVGIGTAAAADAPPPAASSRRAPRHGEVRLVSEGPSFHDAQSLELVYLDRDRRRVCAAARDREHAPEDVRRRTAMKTCCAAPGSLARPLHRAKRHRLSLSRLHVRPLRHEA